MNNNKEKIVPDSYGLSNSSQIIPPQYLKTVNIIGDNGILHEIKYMNVEYINIIKDDIRNNRKLNQYQIYYLKHCIDECTKNDIIDLFIKTLNICYSIISEVI